LSAGPIRDRGKLNPASRSQYPFLLIVQHDRIASIRSVIVAPLTRSAAVAEVSQLHPVADIAAAPYVVVMEELAAVPKNALGKTVGSLEAKRYEIVRAIDLLFTGI
jgi:toxin CcdB